MTNQRGEERGVREGLLAGVASVLRVRFGEPGRDLLPQLQQQTDPEALRRFLEAAETAAGVDELRQLLP